MKLEPIIQSEVSQKEFYLLLAVLVIFATQVFL